MDEVGHDPDKRALLSARKRKACPRPFRGFGRLLSFLCLLAGFLYVGLLIVSRTDRFRELLENQLSEVLELQLRVNRVAVSPGLHFQLSDLQLQDQNTDAGLHVADGTCRINWSASLRSASIQLSSVELQGLAIELVELADGFRSPVPLMKRFGIEQWKVFVEPETAVTLEELEDLEAAEADSARMDASQKMRMDGFREVALRIKGSSFSVTGEGGEEILEITNLSYAYQPKGKKPAKHKMTGSYRMSETAGVLQDLRLEWVDEGESLHFLNPVADQAILRWIQGVREGPVIEVRERL